MKYIKVKLSKLYGFKLYPLMLWNIFLKILMYEDMYELRKHWICLCTEYIFDFLISQADLESLVPRDSFFFFLSLHYSLKFAFFVTIIFCLCYNIAFVLFFFSHKADSDGSILGLGVNIPHALWLKKNKTKAIL